MDKSQCNHALINHDFSEVLLILLAKLLDKQKSNIKTADHFHNSPKAHIEIKDM